MASVSYDVFLCYAWEDFDLACRLNEALSGRGLRVFQDVDGVRDFSDISHEVTAALLRSRSVLAVYTPSFPLSPYCRWEVYSALIRAATLDGHPGRVMTGLFDVDYEDVRPRRLARPRLPRPNTPIADLAESVSATLATIDRRPLGSAPAPPEPAWYPLRVAGGHCFHGRHTELWDVHDALHGEDANAAPPVVRIVGPAGVGKTLLAEQYARVFSHDHAGGVFVLRGLEANPAAVLAAHFADLEVWFGVTPTLDRVIRADQVVATELRRLGAPYLWIVDGLPPDTPPRVFDTLLAPTSNGRTIVTTRVDSPVLGGESIRLGGLDHAAAIRLLTRSFRPRSESEWRIARELVEDLGKHPAAVAAAAGVVSCPGIDGFLRLRSVLTTLGVNVLRPTGWLATDVPLMATEGSPYFGNYWSRTDQGRCAKVEPHHAATLPEWLAIGHEVGDTVATIHAALDRLLHLTRTAYGGAGSEDGPRDTSGRLDRLRANLPADAVGADGRVGGRHASSQAICSVHEFGRAT